MPSVVGGTSWLRCGCPRPSSQAVRCGAVVRRSINASVRCRKAAPAGPCGAVRCATLGQPSQATAAPLPARRRGAAVLCGAVRWAWDRRPRWVAAVTRQAIQDHLSTLVARLADSLTRRIYQSFARTARRRRRRGRHSIWTLSQWVPHALVLIAVRMLVDEPARRRAAPAYVSPPRLPGMVSEPTAGQARCAICAKPCLPLRGFT